MSANSMLLRGMRAMALVAVSVIGAGCHDAAPVTSGPLTAPRAIVPHVTASVTGNTATVTLSLETGSAVGKIGSITGRLRYDAAGLTYIGETTLEDGALRASNPGSGVIRVAVAQGTGLDATRLAEFRFAVRSAAALQALAFDVEEVHEVSRADGRANVSTDRRAPVTRIVP